MTFKVDGRDIDMKHVVAKIEARLTREEMMMMPGWKLFEVEDWIAQMLIVKLEAVIAPLKGKVSTINHLDAVLGEKGRRSE